MNFKKTQTSVRSMKNKIAYHYKKEIFMHYHFEFVGEELIQLKTEDYPSIMCRIKPNHSSMFKNFWKDCYFKIQFY